MKTYITLIQIAGLRRADLARARDPIGEGEVIKLPDGYARTLLESGAIEPSDADETVELHWDAPVELIKSNDPEGLKKALEFYGIDFANGPDRTAVHISGIAPTDIEALAQALEAQGAIVILRGEQFPVGRDLAWFESALEALDPAVGVPVLLAEVARRVGNGQIVAEQLPEGLLGMAWELFAKGMEALGEQADQLPANSSADKAGHTSILAQSGGQLVEALGGTGTDAAAPPPAAAKPAKPARKRA